MRLTVRSPRGDLIATRQSENMVLRNGAAIIARLFSGASSTPIDRVQVGFATASGTPDMTALTPPEAAVAPEALDGPIKPDDFRIALDPPGFVQVNIDVVFQPTVDLENVTEAGLLAGESLYNQVVFEPITLRAGQAVTLFWQVSFPFGHS